MTLKTTHGLTYLSEGDGPETLLFLHGIGGDATSFHHQMTAFPNMRTVAWNMPGYGGSELHQNPPDFAHLSERLSDLIETLGAPVHLMGHSIGGMLALEHAVRRPNHIASIGLIATTPRFGGRDESFKTSFLKARLAPLEQGQSMAEMAANTAPHLVGPNTPADEIAHIAAGMAAIPEATWRGILQCLVTFDRADALAEIACPTFVISGEIDSNAPARTMDKMANALPHASYACLEATGHFPHQERPKEFNAALARFLERTTTR